MNLVGNSQAKPSHMGEAQIRLGGGPCHLYRRGAPAHPANTTTTTNNNNNNNNNNNMFIYTTTTTNNNNNNSPKP